MLDRWQRRGVGDPIWHRLCLLAKHLGLPMPVAGRNGRLPDSALRDLAEQFKLAHTQVTHLLWYAVRTPGEQITAAAGTLSLERIAAARYAAERTR